MMIMIPWIRSARSQPAAKPASSISANINSVSFMGALYHAAGGMYRGIWLTYVNLQRGVTIISHRLVLVIYGSEILIIPKYYGPVIKMEPFCHGRIGG